MRLYKTIASNMWLIVIISISLILLITPLAIFSYLFAVYLASLIILDTTRKDIGAFTSFFIAFLVVTCLQQVIGILLWLLHATLPAPLLVLFLIVIESLYILFIRLEIRRPLTNKVEIISLITALISVLLLATGILRGGGIDTQIIRFVSRGFDTSTHLSLAMTTYDKQGYVYGPAGKVHNDIVFNSLAAYPQGWHLANSSVWHLITDKLSFKDLKTLLRFFFVTILIWYFLLIFAIGRFIGEIAIQASRNISTTLLATGVIGISFLVQAIVTLSLMRYGFVNYIGLIVYIVGILILTLLNLNGRMTNKRFLLTATILSSGAFYTWLLAAPIGIAVIASVFLPNVSMKSLRGLISQWRDHIINAIIVTGFLLLSLVQVVLQVKYSTIPNNIAADTPIWSTNHFLLLSAIVLTLSLITSKYIFTNSPRFAQRILYTSLAVLTTPALLYIYMFTLEGRTGYYFEKMSAILSIVFLCTSGGLVLSWIDRTFARYGTLSVSLIALVMIISLPAVVGADIKELRFAAGKDWTMSDVTARQINTLSSDQTRKDNVIVAKQYDYEEDVIATHFMNVVSQRETRCTSNIGWNQIIKDYDVMAREIKQCAQAEPKAPYTIVASKKTRAFWEHKLSDVKNINILVDD